VGAKVLVSGWQVQGQRSWSRRTGSTPPDSGDALAISSQPPAPWLRAACPQRYVRWRESNSHCQLGKLCRPRGFCTVWAARRPVR